MKKIKLAIISAIFLFLMSFFYLIINDRCKSLSIFSTTLDFGIGYIQTCLSLSNIKENAKKKLVNFPILHDVTIKFYKKYYLNSKKNQEEERTVNKFNLDSLDQNLLKIPFIKGVVNDEELKKNEYISSDDNYEFNSWYRSHGGNWNTKFDFQKKINKKNISKLKLVWKYSSINQEDLQKKWKINVELNPVFINNKIIVFTSDWNIGDFEA
jgi:quinoprotein glucose dehydrogenase